jgi:hypothetical protein
MRLLIAIIYPGSTEQELLDGNFGLSTIPFLALGGFLETPPDTVAIAMGRDLTMYIADNYGPDFDEFNSALRLRALALGYDAFFENAPDADRGYIRDEMMGYVDEMLTTGEYEVWPFRPYLSNIGTMIASSLGLTAICLQDEADSLMLWFAMDDADDIIGNWLQYHVDIEGAYNEGSLYGSWSMRNLIYYFEARKRFDGFDYSAIPKIRNMENWFAYELHPHGGAKVNNIQDCSYLELPLAQNTTYFDWAQSVWGSELASYIWQHVAGTYGHNAGAGADKAGTVLWNQGLTPLQPDSVLPSSMLWENRGLYYYRTGWPSGAASDDIQFSFYSGTFQGGHAQEDQNQFTLTAYSTQFAMDHGPGSDVAKHSEAHNIILIDGAGQHNAGNSIGTDGDISAYILTDYADFLLGDATAAYSTHSGMNNHAFPFPHSDWSWGYKDANPVNFARRTMVAVHDADTPPYFVLFDDIEKDGLPHTYEWRMHTARTNAVDTMANPIMFTDGDAFMEMHILSPSFTSLQKNIAFFNNLMLDPDSDVLSLTTTAVNPRYVMVLVPGDATVTPPIVTSAIEPWGLSATVEWTGGKTDLILINWSGGPVTYPFASSGGQPFSGSPRAARGARDAATTPIDTDASFALLRFDGTDMEKYMLYDACTLMVGDTSYVVINNGTATIGLSGSRIDIDRYDADFVLYAPGVNDVFYRKQRIHVQNNGGYLTPDPVVSVGDDQRPFVRPRAWVHPNPFNPSTTVTLKLPASATVTAVIYDAMGRSVRSLWSGTLPAGTNRLLWNGRNDRGEPVASGVYLLNIRAAGDAQTLKLVLLK